MKPRIHPYISEMNHARVMAMATRPGMTVSTVADAAFSAFFTSLKDDQRDAVIIRKLDRMIRQFNVIERREMVIGETLALYVRYFLMVTPQLPPGQLDAARAKGELQFEQFLDQLGRDVQSGKRVLQRVVDEVSQRAETSLPKLILSACASPHPSVREGRPVMHSATTNTRTADMLMTALGEQIVQALADPSVVEVMINPDGRLWIERHGTGREDTGCELSRHEVERVIRLVATHVGMDATPDAPLVSAELPLGGERFEGVLPPVTQGPCFSIRKPAGRVIRLAEYVETGAMSAVTADALRSAVVQRANILVVGGTGSGKTTLANSLLAEIAETGDRLIILEDTRELHVAAADAVQMRTQPGRVSLTDLVRSTLRLRPDRIIVGEVRGPEALDMLKAWNTGHPGGIATLHANSAHAGLLRLEQLIGEATPNVPHELIAESIDRVVFISRQGGVRRVETVFEVHGLSAYGYDLQPVTADLQLVLPALSSTTPERTNP